LTLKPQYEQFSNHIAFALQISNTKQA